MFADWDNVRSRWEMIRHAVDGRNRTSKTGAILGKGQVSLALNPVAITGEPGAGKTVLYDALIRAIRTGDSDSVRSPDSEQHRATFRSGSRRAKASVVVIPGQQSEEREHALSVTMSGTASPHGIVHVVCWGHNRVWHGAGERAIEGALLARDANFGQTNRGEAMEPLQEQVRKWHLTKEVEDFGVLVEGITQQRYARRLRWMIIAVTKCDLYWDRIEQARDYYIPNGSHNESEFSALLRDLATETSIQIAVLPMSSRLIRHRPLPNLQPQLCQLDDEQLGVIRTHFSDVLQGFVTSGEGADPHGGNR
jgi:hypothetical protein